MPIQDLSRIVSAGVGPIIVISACGLLCLAFYNRLTAIVTRLRTFQRERLRETEILSKLKSQENPDPAAALKHQELLAMLEVQSRHIIARARLIRLSLFFFLLTVACLTLCSLALGLTVLWPPLLPAAALAFVAGLLSLLAGVIVAMLELKAALDPVELETRFVTRIAEEFESL